uniref:Uncharacterized protein n=1 Tax=Caenorhabditis tropicalis TaxID=1561998 RepID=A0A1I7TFE2_9PELO
MVEIPFSCKPTFAGYANPSIVCSRATFLLSSGLKTNLTLHILRVAVVFRKVEGRRKVAYLYSSGDGRETRSCAGHRAPAPVEEEEEEEEEDDDNDDDDGDEVWAKKNENVGGARSSRQKDTPVYSRVKTGKKTGGRVKKTTPPSPLHTDFVLGAKESCTRFPLF